MSEESRAGKESTKLDLIFEFLSKIRSQSYQVKTLGRGINFSLTGRESDEEKDEKPPEDSGVILEHIYRCLLQVNSDLSLGIEILKDVSKELGTK